MKFNLSIRDRQLQQLKQQQQEQQLCSTVIPVQLQQEEPETPPAPAKVPTQEDIDKLTGTLNKERERGNSAEKQLKLLQQQLKAFEGIDPELAKKAADVLQQNQAWDERETKLRADIDGQYRPKLDDYDRQVKAYQQQLGDAQQKLINYQRDSILEREFTKASGFEGEFGAVASALRERTRLNPETGEVEVLDRDGKRVYSKDDPSKPMTVAQLITQLQKDEVWFARHFKGSESGGMGINGSGRNSDPSYQNAPAWKRVEMDRAARGRA